MSCVCVQHRRKPGNPPFRALHEKCSAVMRLIFLAPLELEIAQKRCTTESSASGDTHQSGQRCAETSFDIICRLLNSIPGTAVKNKRSTTHAILVLRLTPPRGKGGKLRPSHASPFFRPACASTSQESPLPYDSSDHENPLRFRHFRLVCFCLPGWVGLSPHQNG